MAEGIDPKTLPVTQRIGLLVKALNGAKRTNEALARCTDGEAMLEVLLDASNRLGLGLTRRDLVDTPPIRDWIWWKNKEALFTIGDNKPRYQQDGNQGRQRPAEGAGGGAEGAGGEAAQGNGEDKPRRRFLGLF
jgi:hypothetical protein